MHRSNFFDIYDDTQQKLTGGVIVSVLVSGPLDCGFVPRSGQPKDYKIGICCFSAKHAALRRKSKDCSDRGTNPQSRGPETSTLTITPPVNFCCVSS
jgi:hypothetical protein